MRPWTLSGRLLLHRALSASAIAWPLLVPPGLAQAQALCEPPEALRVSIQGTVELKRAGTDVWTAAVLEEGFCLGDTGSNRRIAKRPADHGGFVSSRGAFRKRAVSGARHHQSPDRAGDAEVVIGGNVPVRNFAARPRRPRRFHQSFQFGNDRADPAPQSSRMSSPAGGSGRIRSAGPARAPICLMRSITSPTAWAALMSSASARPWPAETLVASLIFASRPRGVELRFSSPPKSQGTLAQAGDWPKLDCGLAGRGRSATF